MQYTITQVQELLHISPATWKRRREEILDYLTIYWDYTLEHKGRSIYFQVHQEFNPIDPLPRKTQIAEIRKFYADESDQILARKPRNTAANLAREITDTNNRYHHAEGTAANYIRPHIKINYEIGDKVWCKINYEEYTYEPISDQEHEYLCSLFDKHLDSTTTANVLAEAEAGYITRKQAFERMRMKYKDALKAFKDKYGFRPYKAGYLVQKAWIDELEE